MLGLNRFGPIVNVEQSRPPFGNTRRLITDADVKRDPKRAHTMVVPGGTAITDTAGNYVHESVWRYLFTHPIEEVGTAVQPETDCLLDQSKK